MPQSARQVARGSRDQLRRWLRGLLDLGIPADSLRPGEMRRVRTIAAATFAMTWVALLSIVQSWVVGNWAVIAYLGVATAAGVGNLLLLHTWRKPNLSGHIAVTILAALISASAVISGGFYNPSFAWLYILPLAAAVSVELRGAAVWAALTVFIAVGFWLLPEVGVHLSDQTPPAMQNLNALVDRVLTILALGAIGVGFVVGQHRTHSELERETTYLQLVMHAAVSANEARSLQEALGDAVNRICTSMGWVAGHVLEVSEDGTCRSIGLAYSALPGGSPLEQLTRKGVFEPGEGIPGRAVDSGSPQIVTDTYWTSAREPGSLRDRGIAAHSLGLAAAFAVPVLAHGRVRAVLEFACAERLPDPDRILEVFTHIGIQLGRVAERTELQERIRQTQKMEAIGQLAAGMAHEINNPMAFVRSNLHNLRQMSLSDEKSERDSEEFHDMIDESLEGVERAISIVRDVTQFSRAGGAGPAEFEPADVNELLRDSLRVASSDLPARVRFRVENRTVRRSAKSSAEHRRPTKDDAPFGRDADSRPKAPYGPHREGHGAPPQEPQGGPTEVPEARARQLGHLVPWVPGQSGNPAGSRRGRTLAQAINALLRAPLTAAKQEDLEKVAASLGLEVARGDDPATLHEIAVTMLEKGLDGNLQWLEAALSRTAPALSRLEVTGAGGAAVEVHRISREMTAEEADELYQRALTGSERSRRWRLRRRSGVPEPRGR